MNRTFLSTAVVAVMSWASPLFADDGPWPAKVANFQEIKAGEHPRLLFRKSDLPALKAKMKTPEGEAILERLRAQLDGKNGDTMPRTEFGKAAKGDDESGSAGEYTISHVAGYGLLYQLTGDKKYADLGRKCMDLALEGQKQADTRYSFRKPNGALRAGPSIGWYALGYDLCYDGWDDAYRQKIAQEFQNYNEGQWLSLAEMSRGARQHPGSNHWGMQVGGAALALLAIRNDPGVDMTKVGKYLEDSEKTMIRNMTQGFGDGGFFPEGDGTGSMASHIAFLPALQAWKISAGKDFISPRPNAQWLALKWFHLTVPQASGKPASWFWPQRGAYPQNIWSRGGLSGAGYFSIGFGVADDDQKAAILWFYENSGLKNADLKNKTPYDVTSHYPHHAVLSFVNWPTEMKAKDPDGIIPYAVHDGKWGFYAWRNRWQDSDDTVISILTKGARGNFAIKAEKTLSIKSQGKNQTWGKINGDFTSKFEPRKDGSTILTCADGSSLAIDFSKASGADALLVMAGPGAPASGAVDVNGTKIALLPLGKNAPPAPQVRGNQVIIGGQTITYDGKTLSLAK